MNKLKTLSFYLVVDLKKVIWYYKQALEQSGVKCKIKVNKRLKNSLKDIDS